VTHAMQCTLHTAAPADAFTIVPVALS
jgi:hypothetical protein